MLCGGSVVFELFLYAPSIVSGASVFVLFWYAFLCVLFSFANILMRMSKLVALLLLSFGHLVAVYVLCLSLMVPWVSLLYVVLVFPDHAKLFGGILEKYLRGIIYYH